VLTAQSLAVLIFESDFREAHPALLCFQNQALSTTAQGGRFFNRNYADFCTGADNSEPGILTRATEARQRSGG
jgi:hypothetical protein